MGSAEALPERTGGGGQAGLYVFCLGGAPDPLASRQAIDRSREQTERTNQEILA